MNAETIRTRFAPSPTGMLHLGSARTALFNWLLAHHGQGSFVLRIEDTDPDRSTADYAEALQQDLRWLGLEWQQGPGLLGLNDSYMQSQRGDIYRNYFDLLEQQGLVYHCFCSEQELKMARKAQLAAGQPPRYPGTCAGLGRDEVVARLNEGQKPTLRFRVPPGRIIEFDDVVRGPQTFNSGDIGDFVIRRADGTPSFFFCNAVDDSLMGVTHILRGEDHLTNTPRQIMILDALALRVPRYGHIAMIVGADGAPLSKRHGSFSVRELAQQGYLPGAVNNYLARLGHHYEDNAYMSLEGLAAQFSVEHLGRAPARYDDEQLRHWQREAILHTDDEDLWQWMGQGVHDIVPASARETFVDTVRANVTFPDDALHWARVVYSDAMEPSNEARALVETTGPGFFGHVLTAYDMAEGRLNRVMLDRLIELTGAKGKQLFLPLRAALTGRLDGPELATILLLLPRERVHRRLESLIESLKNRAQQV